MRYMLRGHEYITRSRAMSGHEALSHRKMVSKREAKVKENTNKYLGVAFNRTPFIPYIL